MKEHANTTTAQHDNQDLLIDRYLSGKLSPEQHAAFEIRLLDEPFLLEQVQIAESMKAALHDHKAALLRTPYAGSGLQLNPLVFVSAWLRQPMSMAATLLVAVLGWQVTQTSDVEVVEGVPQPAPAHAASSASSASLAIASVVQLEGSRGIAAQRVAGTAPYLFKLDAGLGNDATSFAFTLRDAQQHDVVSLPALKADAEGWVQLVIADKLSGNYVATLSWVDAGGSKQQRAFAIVAE